MYRPVPCAGQPFCWEINSRTFSRNVLNVDIISSSNNFKYNSPVRFAINTANDMVSKMPIQKFTFCEYLVCVITISFRLPLNQIQ